MKCLPVFLFILFAHGTKAQYVPDSVTYSPGKFAAYLQSQYKDPSEGLRTLYSWIRNNISYSKDSAMYFNCSVDHNSKIAATLRRRKGVCENFAALLADVGHRLGINTYVVHGYAAYVDKNTDNSHSWVAVQQQGEWYLCDPTWDAQSASEKYYMVEPSAFIQTHIPFDPLWQLMEKPHNYANGGTKFMYKDSVIAFLQLDSLQQLLATARRTKISGDQGRNAKTWQSYNRMNIAVIAGEKDEQLYNEAVGLLNKANQHFNSFVQYRNQQFTPLKTDAEIKEMLSPVEPLLKEAKEKLNNMGKITDNFQYDPGSLLVRLSSLEKRIADQQQFLQHYFSLAAAERIKVLLQ